MPVFLRAKGGLRTWVAIVAAYVFVLQLLLTGILATQMTVASASLADPFVICYGNGTSSENGHPGGNAPPIAHQTCITCAAASTVPLSPVAPQPTVIRFSSAVTFAAPTVPSFLAGKIRTPRTSQGPPQVA